MARPTKRTRSSGLGKPRASSRGKRVPSLQEGVSAGAAAVGEAEREMTESVRASVVRALREPGATAGQAIDAAVALTRDAMAAAREAGGDLLVSSRAVTRGVLLGIADVDGDVVTSASRVAQAAAASAATAGAEARSVALRSLQGIVEAVQALGADAGSAANQAVAAVSDTVLSAGQTVSTLAEQLVNAARTHLDKMSAAAPKRAVRRPKSAALKRPTSGGRRKRRTR